MFKSFGTIQVDSFPRRLLTALESPDNLLRRFSESSQKPYHHAIGNCFLNTSTSLFASFVIIPGICSYMKAHDCFCFSRSKYTVNEYIKILHSVLSEHVKV